MNDYETSPNGSIPRANSIFWGADGLRAGWACLLFLLLFVFWGQAATALLRHAMHGRSRATAFSPGFGLVVESIETAGVLLATAIMARAERRPFASFGLRDKAWLPRFGSGLIAGFAAVSTLVGSLWSLGFAVLGQKSLPPGSMLRYALSWGAVFLLTGVFEEAFLRGYLLFTLRRGMGFWPGAVLLSAAFGLIHKSNPGETPIGLFAAAAVGLLFSLSIFYTGSLWWAIGFHAAWDWGESFFWGTADSGLLVQGHLLSVHPAGARIWSGGATGPEGSLLVFPILLVCALGVFGWWGMRRSPRNAQS